MKADFIVPTGTCKHQMLTQGVLLQFYCELKFVAQNRKSNLKYTPSNKLRNFGRYSNICVKRISFQYGKRDPGLERACRYELVPDFV